MVLIMIGSGLRALGSRLPAPGFWLWALGFGALAVRQRKLGPVWPRAGGRPCQGCEPKNSDASDPCPKPKAKSPKPKALRPVRRPAGRRCPRQGRALRLHASIRDARAHRAAL